MYGCVQSFPDVVSKHQVVGTELETAVLIQQQESKTTKRLELLEEEGIGLVFVCFDVAGWNVFQATTRSWKNAIPNCASMSHYCGV